MLVWRRNRQGWESITVFDDVSMHTVWEMIKGQSNTASSAPSAQVGNDNRFGFLKQRRMV